MKRNTIHFLHFTQLTSPNNPSSKLMLISREFIHQLTTHLYNYRQCDILHTYIGSDEQFIVCLFDLILYVHSTIFQLCGTVLPGFNQY